MPRDVPDPVEPVCGPRKRILTEKAKEAAAIQSMKRIRPAATASVPSKPSSSSDDFLSGSVKLYPIYSLLTIDLQTGDIDNDSEMLSGSRATSPVDSNHSGDTKVYEVSDSEDSEDDDVAEDDDVVEVPTESAEAQLSTKCVCEECYMLTSYQSGLAEIGYRQYTCSSIVCLVLNISMGAVCMSSCVQPPTAKGGMAVMSAASWTLAMRSQQAVFVGTQGCVGETKQ